MSEALAKSYARSLLTIEGEINTMIGTFEELAELTHEEALALLRQTIPAAQLDKLRALAATVQDETIKRDLITLLNSQAYRSRISKREALHDILRVNLGKAADNEIAAVFDQLERVTRDTYLRHVFDTQQRLGFAFDFSLLPENTIREIVSEPWAGVPLSDRIWGTYKNLGDIVEQLLLEEIMTGQNARQMSKAWSDKMGLPSRLYIERLLRTETTHVVARADIEGAKAAGVRAMRFVATLDARTSEPCQEHDGKVVPIEAIKIGVNAPPLHPNCRSCLVDQYGPAHDIRASRDPDTGQRLQVPAKMTYKRWAKQIAPKIAR